MAENHDNGVFCPLMALAEMPDNSVDCVIIDSPSSTIVLESLREIKRVLRNNTRAYVFTHWNTYPVLARNVPEGLKLSDLLVWKKEDGRYEFVMALQKGRRKIIGKRSPNVLSHSRKSDVIRFLIEKSTQKGEGALVFSPSFKQGVDHDG